MDKLPEDVIDALKAQYPEHCETHISWVFLGPEDVYKLKKPVRLPFVDFSTEAGRQAAAEDEVRLNRRLSPDVYFGLVPLTRDAAGNLRFGGDGQALANAVHMRRLPDGERAESMLARGLLTPSHIDALADHIASFHAAAEVDPRPLASGAPGCPATLTRHIEDNLEALEACMARALSPLEQQALCAAQREGVMRLTQTLEARAREGRVRDGHGDLRLDHVYFSADGAIRVLDCVEFERAFRVADVTADVAFFAMNLCEEGRRDLAERFIARYARASADHGLYAVVDLFMTYWALVRAKVCEVRAAQAGAHAEGERDHAERLVRLAHALASERATRPVLFATGGAIGSGKSRLSQRVSEEVCAPVLQSDRLRKQLRGVPLDEPLDPKTAYTAQATRALYDELYTRAETILESGRPVVVDASFRAESHRAQFQALASRLGVPFQFLECSAPRDALETRLRAREHKQSVSDARVELLDSFLARYEPLSAEEVAAGALRVDTTGTKDETFASVSGRVFALVGLGEGAFPSVHSGVRQGPEATVDRAASRPAQ